MMILAAIGGLLSIGLLGVVVVQQFRAVQLRDARDIGSAYIQGFLTPYVQEAHDTGRLSDMSALDLMRTVGTFSTARQFEALRIRAPDGSIIFASDAATVALAESPDDFLRAQGGEAVAELHWPVNADRTASIPAIEIYAPIYDRTGETLIAVGEIYQDAGALLGERQRFEQKIWAAFGLASLGFVAMMLLIGQQHRQLIANLGRQRQIALHNAQLKVSAEAAWHKSSQSNEALLNQIGAELHDGPIQMLTLLTLMAPAPAPTALPDAGQSPGDVASAVLADLRRISGGLILPELGGMTVRETLMLAVTRHRNTTATEIACEIGLLPDSVDEQRKVCLYRIVQEGLNNTFRHGDGRSQSISAHQDGDTIIVTVRNSLDARGRQGDAHKGDAMRAPGLGVQGLRNRLKVFGGTLSALANDNGQFTLTAHLPLG
jgi:signal transduction histidine kinase